MVQRRGLLATVSGLAIAALASGRQGQAAEAFPVTRSDAEWRRLLTPTQYAILRQAGTEVPESSPLDHDFRPGRYDCAGCGHHLFSSEAKFESHTGWPSFWQPLPSGVATSQDNSFGATRTEVHCSDCGGHLGHMFDDGPKPTGLRYCMNGAVLAFHPNVT